MVDVERPRQLIPPTTGFHCPNSCDQCAKFATMTETPPKRRVRNEAQLNQKRLVDRIKHKENRQENKQRLEKIETSIAGIESKLDSLALVLQSLPRTLTAPTSIPPALPPAPDQSQAVVPASYDPFCQPFHANAHLPSSGQGHAHSQSPPNMITKIWGYTPPPQPGSSRMLDCRCGSLHPDHFECLEACNVTALYRSHVEVVPPVSASPFPRNPSLPSMMLHRSDENILTFFITGFLQQRKAQSIEQLLGFYLLGYRYMRVSGTPTIPEPRNTLPFTPRRSTSELTCKSQWQMNPSADTIQDIPTWIIPTEAQKTHPHSVVVDFLAWPPLRDYICTSGDADVQQSILFYFDSIQFRWLPNQPLFAQSDSGQITISPEFEKAVFELENWSLGPPWSDTFPHLMHLTQP